MKKLLAVLAALFIGAVPAHAQSSKVTINSQIDAFFPDNTVGSITPAKLRTVTKNIVASYVDWLSCTGTGGIVYWNAGTPTCLAAGPEGYVLGIASGIPSWMVNTPSFVSQNANTVLAGPSSGIPAAPNFRALVGADLPSPSASTLGGVQSKTSVASQWLNSISTSGVPTSTQPAFSDISGQTTLGQLPTIASGAVLANATAGAATPTAATATSWFDRAFCSTVGYVVARTTGGWVCSNSIPAPITWFGAVCDGSTDDITAINAAIVTLTGKTILFPSGKICNISSEILISASNGQTTLKGDGFLNATIRTTSATANIIRINVAGSSLTGIGVENIYLDATSAKSAGFGIAVTGTAGSALYRSTFRNIQMSANMCNGLSLATGGFFNSIEDVELFGVCANGIGFQVKGVNASTRLGSVYFNNTACRSGTSGGASGLTRCYYFDDFAEGIYGALMTAESPGLDYGLYIANTSGVAANAPKNVIIDKLIADNPNRQGIQVDYVRTFSCSQCWLSSAVTGPGGYFVAGTDIQLVAPLIFANALHGVRFGVGATHAQVLGGNIDGNGINPVNSSGQILFDAGATDFSVIGTRFTRAGSSPQAYADIYISPGASARYIVKDNSFGGGITFDLYDGGTGHPKIVNDNIPSASRPTTVSACGTSPSIVGNDYAGTVTVGTGSPTSCTITFGFTQAVAPSCILTWGANLATMSYAVNTNNIVATQTATSSNTIRYSCKGV